MLARSGTKEQQANRYAFRNVLSYREVAKKLNAKPKRAHRSTGGSVGRPANEYGKSPRTDKDLIAKAKAQIADPSSPNMTLHKDVARLCCFYCDSPVYSVGLSKHHLSPLNCLCTKRSSTMLRES